jgi:D-sedoheptulose 7-phosphate isomerase
MIKSAVKDHLKVVKDTFDTEMINNITEIGSVIDSAFKTNGKVIFFGNGGSAADAQHIAAEFISRLSKDRVSLPAIALTVDTSALTAIGNDYGYDQVFSRQITSLCSERDVVIGISTSGHSQNVIKGLLAAKEIGAKTIGFTGVSGMSQVKLDFCLSVPSNITARIQEIHIMLGHLICGQAELNYV